MRYQRADVFSVVVVDIFTNPSVLAHFDPSAATEVPKDARGHTIAAVLTQQLQGIHCVVAFCCCGSKITPSQNASVKRLSGRLQYFDHICIAGHLRYQRSPFTPLACLAVRCLSRWALRLQEYTFLVSYRSEWL